MKVKVIAGQSYLTLCHPMGCSPPGSSVHGIPFLMFGFPGGPMQETQVRSLGGEDPLEKVMATHSSILAWRNPWTEKPGQLQSLGHKRVGHDFATK